MSSDLSEEVSPKIKMDSALKCEIASGGHHLKVTEKEERKNLLPTADEVKAEKKHLELLKGVEEFASGDLKVVKTREPASAAQVVRVELAHGETVKGVTEFDKKNLKHAETLEKNLLPDKNVIKAEAEHEAFKRGIEGFDKDKLAKTPTMEKNTLPTMEVLEREKSA